MDHLTRYYPAVLSRDFCDFVIDKFESSENKFEGITASGVNKEYKASTDLMINLQLDDPEWLYVYNYLMEALLQKTVDYVSKIPFVFLGGEYSSKAKLVRGTHQLLSASSSGRVSVQMQRYIGNEGYYAWHFENEGGHSVKRQLFFIFYMNDVNGGETEFKFDGTRITPSVGSLLMAPAFWTHMHRGNPPGEGQTKYIITGWLETTDAEIKPEF